MNTINIVYSLSGGTGVSYISSFLSCYKEAIGVDLNYQHPSLKRYKNVFCMSEDSMVFLEGHEYESYCQKILNSVFNGFAKNKTKCYVLDVGNLLLLEFIDIFKSKNFLDFLKKRNVEVVFHCVISGNDTSFNKRSLLVFREVFKYLENSSLVVWENRYFKNTNNDGLKIWAEEVLGASRCTYKIIEEESGILTEEIENKMKFVVPLSSEEIKKGRDTFQYIRLKKYYRKWEELTGRKEFLF